MSPNFKWKLGGGYVQKWYLQYKTSDISEIKQSRPKLPQSVYRNSCMAYCLVTNLVTYGELWPTFLGSKIFPQGISHTLFVGAQLHLAALASRNSFPTGVPWYHAATCINPSLMHLQSGCSTTSPMFDDSFRICFCSLDSPRLNASFLYKCPASHGSSLRQYGLLLSIFCLVHNNQLDVCLLYTVQPLCNWLYCVDTV